MAVAAGTAMLVFNRSRREKRFMSISLPWQARDSPAHYGAAHKRVVRTWDFSIVPRYFHGGRKKPFTNK